MQSAQPAREQDVVGAWLVSELDLPRMGSFIHACLRDHGATDDLVRRPNLDDPAQNRIRAAVLGRARGWGNGTMIFTGFPDHVRWYSESLSLPSLRRLRYMGGGGMDFWAGLAGPGHVVGDAADRLRAASVPGLPDFTRIAQELDSGTGPTPLILAGRALSEHQRVVVDGCHRVTGYCLATNPPLKFPAFVGISSAIATWGRW